MKKLMEWVGRSKLTRHAATVIAPRRCFDFVMDQQRGFGPFYTLSFDCDFHRDIDVLPKLTDLLARYGSVASFACIGQWVRQFPDHHRGLVKAGHEIVNHTQTHPNLYHPAYEYARIDGLSRLRFNEISKADRRREIEECHRTIEDVLSVSPRGFRSPHFGELHVDDVYVTLRDLGYLYSSSVLAAAPNNDGLPYRTPEGLWEFPVSPCPEHPFGVLDSWHALGKANGSHAGPGELAGLFRCLGQKVERDGGYLNVYLDPKVCVESGEMQSILEYLSCAGLESVTYSTLVERLSDAATAHGMPTATWRLE